MFTPFETPALLALGEGGGWGGNCTLDGMRMDCADVSHMMEVGAVATEYLIHTAGGFRYVQSEIVSLGVGIFGSQRPTGVHSENPNEVTMRDFTFSFLPPNPFGRERGPMPPTADPVPAAAPAAQNNDPCAGKKDQLNYPPVQQATYPRVGGIGSHISDRHISQRLFPGKSKYVFGDMTFHNDQSNSSMRRKGDDVMQRNTRTFLRGVGTVQNGGNIAYVFAFPDHPALPMLGLGAEYAANGVDRINGNVITNVNTLILKPDCQTVVTSFPGLPSSHQFPGGTFNIVGTPRTFPLNSPQNPGWR
jgi:hypothetical protein